MSFEVGIPEPSPAGLLVMAVGSILSWNRLRSMMLAWDRSGSRSRRLAWDSKDSVAVALTYDNRGRPRRFPWSHIYSSGFFTFTESQWFLYLLVYSVPCSLESFFAEDAPHPRYLPIRCIQIKSLIETRRKLMLSFINCNGETESVRGVGSE